MKKDIKERLREIYDRANEHKVLVPIAVINEAANEIERLRNTIKNCPPVSESEYVRRTEDEIERLRARRKGWKLISD